MRKREEEVTLNYDVQQISLFSHLQSNGSCKQIGHMTVPQPIHVLFFRLHAQCLHLFIISTKYNNKSF